MDSRTSLSMNALVEVSNEGMNKPVGWWGTKWINWWISQKMSEGIKSVKSGQSWII